MLSFPVDATRYGRVAGVVLCAVVLTFGMTWPLGWHPASVGRVDTGDGRFSIWNVAWIAHAVLTDPTRLFDANIFYPHTGTLAYSEANLVAGLMAVPAYALTGDGLLAHNSVVFGAFVLTLVSTYALARRLGLTPGGSAVAAVGFAFSPAVMARSAHIQLLLTVAFPVAMIAFHAYEGRPSLSRGARLGAALAFAALCCGYYGIFAGLMVGFAALVYGLWGWKPRRPGYWLGLGLGAAVSVALVWPVFQYYRALQATGFKAAANLGEARMYSADWRAYLASPAHAHAWILRLLEHWPEVLFPGFIVTALGLWGFVVAWRRAPKVAVCYGGMAGLAFWASFGPAAGLYAVAAEALPFMSFLRAPARFGFVVIFALAILAGFAVDAWSARPGARRVPLVIGAVLLLEIGVVPWSMPRVAPIPSTYYLLRRLPPGPVIEYPFPYVPSDFHRHTLALYNSMAHWHPLVNGYSDFVPPDFQTIARPVNAFPDAASFELLRARDVRYVIWRIDEYSAAGREEIARRIAVYPRELRALSRVNGIWLYEIAQWPSPQLGAAGQ